MMLVILLKNKKEHKVNVLEASRELLNLKCEYDQYLHNESGLMNKVGQQYLDMVEILFDFLFDFCKSVGDGNWNLHIAASKRMLEWFSANDHTNYIRHLMFYWASKPSLSQSHPNMLKEFQKGNFSVRMVPRKFYNLSADQVIKQTVNQDHKGPGGTIGYSMNEGTVQQWILASHSAARLISQMEDSLQLTKSKNVPKDLAPTQVS